MRPPIRVAADPHRPGVNHGRSAGRKWPVRRPQAGGLSIVTTSIGKRIAQELGVREQQVTAAIELIDGGATVPFIARYRKEATGMLDDAQLRTLEERLRYLREMDARRLAIIESIKEQGKLTPEN